MNPPRWPSRRLKTLASVRVSNVDKKSVDGEQAVRLCNYTDVYYRDRIVNDIEFKVATAPAHQIRRFALMPGDVLITKDSESWDDIAVSAVVSEPVEAICGYHLALLRPLAGRLNGRFLSYVVASAGTTTHFKVRANGVTRYAIGTNAIGDAPIPAPPLSAQVRVADYLDGETARIDSLIDRKLRFIDLLLEKRAALIDRAVTNGLDPEVEIGETSHAWLGDLPAHWSLTKLTHLVDSRRPVMYGIVLPGPDFDGGVLLVKGGDVESGDLLSRRLNRVDPAVEARHARSRLKEGDLLYAIRGSHGGVAEVPAEIEGANVTQDAARVAPRLGVCGRWLLWTLRSQAVEGMLSSLAVGATIKGINIRDLKKADLPLPPLLEQQAIARYLDAETARIDALVNKIRASIGLLKEYRTAIISVAVTGQIEVPCIDTREEVA